MHKSDQLPNDIILAIYRLVHYDLLNKVNTQYNNLFYFLDLIADCSELRIHVSKDVTYVYAHRFRDIESHGDTFYKYIERIPYLVKFRKRKKILLPKRYRFSNGGLKYELKFTPHNYV